MDGLSKQVEEDGYGDLNGEVDSMQIGEEGSSSESDDEGTLNSQGKPVRRPRDDKK